MTPPHIICIVIMHPIINVLFLCIDMGEGLIFHGQNLKKGWDHEKEG